MRCSACSSSRKRSGANEVKTAEAVAAAMEELAAKDGSIHYAIPYVASEYINVAVDAALEGIILGVVLALTPLFTSVVLSYLLAATLIVEGASIKRIER